MSLPDFERAQYGDSQAIAGEVVGGVSRRTASAAAFPIALLYGIGAAIVGAIGYGLFSLTGFMVSIVAIGVAWLIAKAMMLATGGIGGRQYQIAAVVLTYLSVSAGELVHPIYLAVHEGAPLSILFSPKVLEYVVAGPFLELQGGFNGIIGIVILGIGMRSAWRMAAGGPMSGRRATPFG
jgi:hypothetical protein